FEEDILDISLELLDNNPKFLLNQDKDCARRNSPVYVSRVVSAMVNCNDDKGILFGRWDNRYDDGVSPMTWSGSVDILRRWQKYGCQPVRYGQCWVFAAVACTGENLSQVKMLPRNFHCWVECWMARPDLPSGYDGWQALDPTPQEKSEGVYCCGPTPVKAVREGDLDLKYDVKFVFAEVNAEVAFLMLQSDLSRKKTMHPTIVGKKISTKSVGRDTKEDITHTYKHREDSEEERASFDKAKHEKTQTPQEEGLALKIKASEGMNNGCDFDVFVVVNNNTPEERHCRLRISAATTSYNGELGPECGCKDLLNVNLEPHGEKTVPLRIPYEKYGGCLTPDNMIKVTAVLQQYENQKILLGVRDFHVKNPDIKIRVRETPVEPGEEAKVMVDFVPQQFGLRKLVVDFESDKLKGVKGYRNVIIAPQRK
ncbi:protein-glutamine gamma-glutamyltransferase 2, partial [Protobothrops mucrosquamatus]|uniref:protein-glutamine gamma-glutamyltransferase 2 n=1 Tax=Protobothrops mucrosquamatus TaxID=103944 RepID=UPI0007759ADE